MKRRIAWLLACVLLIMTFAGCANTTPTPQETTIPEETQNPQGNNDNEPSPEASAEKTGVTIRLGGLKGPTTMGLVKLLEDNENELTANDYEFTMAAAADELTPKLVQGQLDILVAPANLGAVLYQNTQQVQQAAVTTLGVVYIVEKGGQAVHSFADLKGQTIYATGKGSTPEYALRYLLAQSGLDPDKDVTIEWKSEPTEIVAILGQKDTGVALMPQPFVTVAQTQVDDLRIALDLTREWDRLSDQGMLITAGVLVRKGFAEEHPEALKTFLREMEASTEYATKNPEDAAALIEKQGIVKAPIAQKALPYCSLVFITGDEMKDALQGYFQVLYDQNPKSVGGSVPDDNYYYYAD